MSQTQDFGALLELERDDTGAFHWEAPDGWQQGRGAFGGLVVAAMIRALEARVEAPSHTLRSLTATLCGPVMPGLAELEVELLRGGSGTTTMAVALRQEGAVQAHCVGLLGGRRVEDGDWSTRAVPEMPDWQDMEAVAVGPPMAPVFTQHVEYWPTHGIPYSGASERRTGGWVRLKEPGPARDAAWLAAHIDAYWPAAFVQQEAPRPMATVGFMLEFLHDLEGLDPQAPLYYTASSENARGGWMAERRELWSAGGELLALNHQTIAIIK